MLAVVLTFDSLPCAALGCYGNEWIDSPHFDRLAAEGFVFDTHVARSVDGALRRDEPFDWWTALTASGVHAAHLREARARFGWDSVSLSDVVRIDGRVGADAPPREWPFAQLMNAGRKWLAESVDPAQSQLLWLHSAGIPLPCLVPPDVESLYVDEFADRGVDWSALSDEERGQHPVVQAGYVSCLDHFLGEFLDALAAVAVGPKLMAIGALYGGKWQTIPRRCELPAAQEAQRLRSPSIWWTSPSQTSRIIVPGRSPAIVRPQDLGPTLLEWFATTAPSGGTGRSLWPIFDGSTVRVRDTAFIDGGVLWTESDVTVVTEPSVDPAAIRRFLWPEDLWQVNDVAAQTPEIVAERLLMIEAQR